MEEIQWNGREISLTGRIVGPRFYRSAFLFILTIRRGELWTSLIGVGRVWSNPGLEQGSEHIQSSFPVSIQGFKEIVLMIRPLVPESSRTGAFEAHKSNHR